MEVNNPTLDLESIVERLEKGRLSLGQAKAEIKAYAGSYTRPDLDSYGENLDAFVEILDSWSERIDELMGEVRILMGRILSDPNPVRVNDLGEIMCIAAGLADAEREDLGRFLVARRLIDLDQHRSAMGFLEAIQRAEEDLEPLFGWMTLNCLVCLGRFDEAERLADEVVVAARRVGNRATLAESLYWSGRACRGAARREQALAHAREALALRRRLDEAELESLSDRSEAAFCLSVGILSRNAGRFDEAFRAFEEGRLSALKLGNPYQAAYLLSETGYTWMLIAESGRSADVLRRAADEAAKAGYEEMAAHWRSSADISLMNDALERDGDPTARPRGIFDEAASFDESEDLVLRMARAVWLINAEPPRLAEARKILIDCLAEAKALPERQVEANVRHTLSMLYDREGKSIQAEIALREAIRVAEDAAMRSMALGFQINLVNLLMRRGRIAEADVELDNAIHRGEILRDEATSNELRQALGGMLSRAYDQRAFSLSTNIRYESTNEYRQPQPEKLFEVGQRTRAVNLTGWLRLGEIGDGEEDSGLVESLLALRAAEVRLEAAAVDGDASFAELNAQLGSTRQAFVAAAAARNYNIAVTKSPDSIGGVRAVLAPGDCLIDLLSILNGVCITGFCREGTIACGLSPSSRSERVGVVRDWTQAIRSAAFAENYLAEGRPNAEEGWVRSHDRLEEVAARMDRLLFEPVAEHIRGLEAPGRLLIVPHRELLLFPYWRLVRLFPEAAISVLPTSGAVIPLVARRRGRDHPWIAYGDVTGTLRYSEREIGDLRGYERGEPFPSRMVGPLATASRVHFTGHGHFDQKNPYRSGLVVAAEPPGESDPMGAPDPYGRPNRTLLTVAQIIGRFHMPRCDLAVLSACRTGLPREHPASEFTSLPAALMIAGARNVVASLWQANDVAATLLMQEFYAGLDARPPSRALAAARRRIATMGRDEICRRIGGEFGVPQRDLPFAGAIYTDAFQHYGID